METLKENVVHLFDRGSSPGTNDKSGEKTKGYLRTSVSPLLYNTPLQDSFGSPFSFSIQEILMGTPCLTQPQKDSIVTLYQNKTMTQKQLAHRFNVSERTINRVFIAAGIATPVARIKGEAYHVMQLLKKYNVDLAMLKTILAGVYGPRA